MNSWCCCRDLAGQGLQGQLPWDSSVWSGLGSLMVVNLADNNINGYLPPQVSAGLGLRSLSISNNSFQGSLPNTLSSNLEIFNAAGNQFTGKESSSLQRSRVTRQSGRASPSLLVSPRHRGRDANSGSSKLGNACMSTALLVACSQELHKELKVAE